MNCRTLTLCLALLLVSAAPAPAQERPYFVTYDHHLEEARDLEVSLSNTTGIARENAPTYHAPWLELEYGVTSRWTTELYLEGLATQVGGGFTGWRWENRFRPLKRDHPLNPVIYLEYEVISEASRIQTEVVGSGALSFEEGVAHLRSEHAREFEAKLILSSTVHAWNIAENVIVEKNLSEAEGFEFGYAAGVSRPLGGLAPTGGCRFCRTNFVVGVEAYGGLGSTEDRGLSDTRHYVAPVLAWRATRRNTVKVSAGFGLTEASDRALIRVGYVRELW